MLILLFACANPEKDTETTEVAETGPLDPLPPDGGQQLTSQSYTIEAHTEKYYCYTFRSPDDAARAITEVVPIQGVAIHHVAVFKTTEEEKGTAFECPILVKTSWEPIWAGGAGAKGLVLPEGTGFVVEPNTQYLVQYHILNATDKAITERSAINFAYSADTDAIIPAGLYAFGTFDLNVPAQNPDYEQSYGCEVPRDMNIFAVFPHMHKVGAWANLATGPSEAELSEAYRIDPWVFGDQPMQPVDIKVKKGEYFKATCAWNNNTDHDIGFGESTEDEMCFVVTFYYPWPGLDGCLL